MVGFTFQDLCFKKVQFEPSVAYKSVANKKKRVIKPMRNLGDDQSLYTENEKSSG